MRMPVTKKTDKNEMKDKGIDPALIKQAIQAIQQQRRPSK